MKFHITRIDPHQNAKVLAMLLSAFFLVVSIPVAVVGLAIAPAGQQGPILSQFLATQVILLLLYPVISYVFIRIGLAVFNKLVPHIGGFEFEASNDNP